MSRAAGRSSGRASTAGISTSRETLDTQLNVFAEFEPKLSAASRDADVLFLANIQPDLQRAVRVQCEAARFAALDSMNLWIETSRDSLIETIARRRLRDAQRRRAARSSPASRT